MKPDPMDQDASEDQKDGEQPASEEAQRKSAEEREQEGGYH